MDQHDDAPVRGRPHGQDPDDRLAERERHMRDLVKLHTELRVSQRDRAARLVADPDAFRREYTRAGRQLKCAERSAKRIRERYEAALHERLQHYLAGGLPAATAQARAESDTAELRYDAHRAESRVKPAAARWMRACDDVDDTRLLRDWHSRRAQQDGVRLVERHAQATRRPRGCDRQARPRARRSAASSRSSSADPGDDGGSEPPPPGLKLWRHPHFGSCSPNLLRLLLREAKR